MMAAVAEVLQEALDLPGEFTFLKLPGRHALVLMVFPTGSSLPVCLVKPARDPRRPDRLAREAAALVQAGRQAVGTDAEGPVPRMLAWQDGAQGCLLVQSALLGTPLIKLLRSSLSREVHRSGALLETAFGWLVKFHRAAVARAQPRERPLRDCLLAPFGGTAPEDLFPAAAKVIETALTQLRSLGYEQCRVCLCHGDYSPNNIVMGPAGIGVHDWEEAHMGLPLLDVCNLFTLLVCDFPHRDPGKMAQRFHAHFCDPAEAHVRRAMATHVFGCAERLSFAPEFVNSYYPIHLLHLAAKWQGRPEHVAYYQDLLAIYQDRLGGRLSEA